MQLAIIADWLTTFGGAEHAIAQMLQAWPGSPVYTTVARRSHVEPLANADIRTTRLQSLYGLVRRHQLLLPLLPRAIESIDLRGFDVILSSSHAVAKGVIPPPGARHVCYCHTPMRYAWEMEDEYLHDFGIPRVLHASIKRRLKRLRRWDLSTAKRVDLFLANSIETQSRIERIYGRSSVVVAPPVDDRFFTPALTQTRAEYLAVGRLVPYKRFDLLIETCNRLRLPLQIAGKGQEERRLKAMAGPTVTFLGYVPDADLPALYAKAAALFFPPHEDAGIVPLEAQACGTPVIAYGKGGALDTVIDGKTGIFFTEQTTASLQDAIARFEKVRFDPAAIRDHARGFSAEKFRDRLRENVEKIQKPKTKYQESV